MKNTSVVFFTTITIFLEILFGYHLWNKNNVIKEKELSNKLRSTIIDIKEKELEKLEKRAEENEKKIEEEIEKISRMSKDQIINSVIKSSKEKIENELELSYKKEINNSEERKKVLSREIIKIIASSLERYSINTLIKSTSSRLSVDKTTVSRIIGKEGRNVNYFKKITGAEIVVNQNKKNKEELVSLEVSSFNSIRKEIAFITLKKLIDKNEQQKITHSNIEKNFNDSQEEININIRNTGKKVVEELEINDMEDGLIFEIGKLSFRSSYGQNVLNHSIEVAKIAANIASEMGLDEKIALRGGILHDIGKAEEENINLSHIINGINTAIKYKESEIIINIIESHHDRSLANNLYSYIVACADKLSAARPGARNNQKEIYVTRMKDIENISNEFSFIKQIYSFQSGREIWVIVDHNKVKDHEMLICSALVREKIRQKIIIPGEVIINFIREFKIVEKITNSGRELDSEERNE